MTLAAVPTDLAQLRVLLGQLERRYEIGQQAGGDGQAGWLRNRIVELRRLIAAGEGPAGSLDRGPVGGSSSGGCSAVSVPADPQGVGR